MQRDEHRIHYVEHGTGAPLVALHGGGVDHRDVEAALESLDPGGRRIYPDLPGHGRSGADGLDGNDDVVAALADFIAAIADGPVLLLGHSYGGYLARGVLARRPELVRGLALVCPIAEHTGPRPTPSVVREDPDAHGELEPEQRAVFDEYFVVRTAATARRYRDHIWPGTTLVDRAAMSRIAAGWAIDLGAAAAPVPAVMLAGRCDATAGWADSVELLERYPRAALAVLADAGHALLHEQPELVGPLLRDWVDRAGSAD